MRQGRLPPATIFHQSTTACILSMANSVTDQRGGPSTGPAAAHASYRGVFLRTGKPCRTQPNGTTHLALAGICGQLLLSRQLLLPPRRHLTSRRVERLRARCLRVSVSAACAGIFHHGPRCGLYSCCAREPASSAGRFEQFMRVLQTELAAVCLHTGRWDDILLHPHRLLKPCFLGGS